MRKQILKPPENGIRRVSHKHRVIHCPLFHHMKHTDACTVLRAKGVCKTKCESYFRFASENRDSVKFVIEKYAINILDHRRRYELPEVDLVEYAMPTGKHICSYCGKDFIQEARLKNHVEKKHKRELHSKNMKGNAREISCSG